MYARRYVRHDNALLQSRDIGILQPAPFIDIDVYTMLQLTRAKHAAAYFLKRYCVVSL